MKKKAGRKGKKLHLVPLILGAYSALLGISLMVLGLASFKEGALPGTVGKLRLFGGLVLAGLGLFGIWDGIRDLLKSGKRTEEVSYQYILTGIDGKRSSNVSKAQLQAQLEGLAKAGRNARVSLEVLPQPFLPDLGQLLQVTYVYADSPKLIAFFQPEGGPYAIRQKEADFAEAGRILERFLDGAIDFSSWEATEMEMKAKEASGRRCLRIFGESWKDEHPFFSLRDLELTMEGLAEGKYQRMELLFDKISLCAFRKEGEESSLVLQLYLWDESRCLHIFERAFTLTQAKFWLVRIFYEGMPIELDGWNEIGRKQA